MIIDYRRCQSAAGRDCKLTPPIHLTRSAILSATQTDDNALRSGCTKTTSNVICDSRFSIAPPAQPTGAEWAELLELCTSIKSAIGVALVQPDLDCDVAL